MYSIQSSHQTHRVGIIGSIPQIRNLRLEWVSSLLKVIPLVLAESQSQPWLLSVPPKLVNDFLLENASQA